MRIASLQPSITLTLHALGRADHLCACTRYCLEALPELGGMQLPVIHDSWSASTSEILSTNPDLVVASVPYRMESLAALLKTAVPVLALAPHALADIFRDIRLLAKLTGAVAQGDLLIANIENTLRNYRERTANLTKPRVYCEEWGKPLIHSQAWVAELVEAAGGEFAGTPGAHTTPDAVGEADPDVLIFAWCGAGDRVPLDRVVTQRGWQSLRAVRERRVYCVPDEWLNTPAHTLLQGLACLAAAIHPEQYSMPARLVRL